MILCCGEALIDMLPAATAKGEAAWLARPGGAVFNTAIALARLGASAGLLTGLSTDAFGRRLRAVLEEEGVDLTFSVGTDRKTALAFVDLVEGQASYSFHDEGSAARMLTLEDMPSLPDEVSTLFFGGISLVSEPCATALEALQALEAGRRTIMLDPNVRPAFIADEAAYRARLDRMMRRSDIVKVSEEDLHWLIPNERPLHTKIQDILDLGAALAVVTLGSGGAVCVSAGGFRAAASAKKVQVADTVGAGDTFNAGFLAKLADLGFLRCAPMRDAGLKDLEAALEYGSSAAAVTVSRIGAEPPRASELV